MPDYIEISFIVYLQ